VNRKERATWPLFSRNSLLQHMSTATGLVRREFDRFDEYQFAGRKSHSVSIKSALAWADVNRMHVDRRAITGGRWTVAPAWSQNDVQMREVILRFLEARLYIYKHEGTNEDRLKVIQERAVAQIPGLETCLKALLARYNKEARRGEPQSVLDKTAVQIQNLDAQICMLRRGIAAVVTSFAYMHFRLLHQSTQIAETLGVKPQMIRIWAHRMQLLAREVLDGVHRPRDQHHRQRDRRGYKKSYKAQHRPAGRRPKYNRATFFEMRKAGNAVSQIAKATGASGIYIYKCLRERGFK
jgi:hypothetical protein